MRPLGAQISHMLKDRGVEVIFGIPGVHNQEMYRGIEEAGLTHVLARHEQGAGFMADGYARATGRPGVCYVITGPGLCNIMTPMGQAYSDSVPMVVISSCLDEVAAKRGQLHQMKDQRAAADCVADWSHEARTADAAYQLIDRAFTELQAARPRPKHIQVPIATLQGEAANFPPGMSGDIDSQLLPVSSHVADAAQAILRAKSPLFVFGGGCVSDTGSAPPEFAYVRDLLQRSGAAAFTSYAGRGILPPEHPQNFGSFLGRPSSADIFAKADLLVVFGSELSECDLWRNDIGHDCPLIRVDLEPTVLASGKHTEAQYQQDALSFITQLAETLPSDVAPKWDLEDISQCRKKWRAEVDAERPGILPVIDALRSALPAGTMIYSDMTQFAYAAKEAWGYGFAGSLAPSHGLWHAWVCHARSDWWPDWPPRQANNGDHWRLRVSIHDARAGCGCRAKAADPDLFVGQ